MYVQNSAFNCKLISTININIGRKSFILFLTVYSKTCIAHVQTAHSLLIF